VLAGAAGGREAVEKTEAVTPDVLCLGRKTVEPPRQYHAQG